MAAQNKQGRASVHNIEVTIEQWEWIQRTVTRKAEHAAKTPGVNSKIKAALGKFADKLQLPPENKSERGFYLVTNRQDLRFLQEIAKNDHAMLLTQVIPGYMDRVDRSLGPARDRYEDYLKRAESQVALVAEILNVVERGLNR